MSSIQELNGPTKTIIAALAAALLLAACSSDAIEPQGRPATDTGADASVDVPDPGEDIGDRDTGDRDADKDTGADTVRDTSPQDTQSEDATDDASTSNDANTSDDVSTSDAGADADPDAGPDADAAGGCTQPELKDYPEWSEATDIAYQSDPDPKVYAEVFNAPFPGTTNTIILDLEKGTYASIEFHTPSDLNSTHAGAWHAEKPASAYPMKPGPRLMSVSRCPGEFDPANIEPDCIEQLYTANSFYWRGPGHADAAFRCELQADTTYYLNIVFADSPLGQMPPVQAACSDADRCGTLLYPVYNY